MSGVDLTAELDRAGVLIELGRYDDAALRAGSILGVDPSNVRAACLLAQAEIGRRRFDDALRAAKGAAVEDPSAEWPQRLASLALMHLGKANESIAHAREAVRLAPHEYRAHMQLAQALTARSLRDARAAAVRALELAPHAADAHFVVGRVAAAGGRRDEAKRAFARALALDPDHSPAHNELARLRLRRFRLADAAIGFSTALRADPQSEVSRQNLELVVRAFLTFTAAFVYLGAFIGFGTASRDVSTAGRIAPLAVLIIPSLLAVRFTIRLPRSLRRYLRDRIQYEPAMRDPALLSFIAVVALIAEALASQGTRFVLGAAALLAAIASRFLGRRSRGTRTR
jgi:tetratricopeptide (TPR) repeat protein